MANEKKSNSKRIVLWVICILLGVILVGLVAGAIYLESRLNMLNRVDPSQSSTMSSEEAEEYLSTLETEDSDYTGETMDPTDVTWDTEPTEPPVPVPELINILLIGQDRREGEARARSDSMILCTINTKEKTLTMTSFMRDMYIQIPGYKDNRINASYAFGGMPLLNATLEKNFGVVVDGNVEVDFNGFIDVIDLLGGVDMELTKAEARAINKNTWWGLSKEDWNLTEGMNHLTGAQALAYSRVRSVGGDGDFGRTNRQRKVLGALLDKAKKLNVIELDNLLVEILPLLTTDLSNAEILNYASILIPMLPELEIKTMRIPVDGSYQMTMIRGMSVLVPNLQKNRDALQPILTIPEEVIE